MDETNFVVGGFSQPSVSRALIEYQGNTEKGFSQRFLWFFPKPVMQNLKAWSLLMKNLPNN